MKPRRDILLFGTLALAAAAGGWWLLINKPGAAIDAFQREYRQQQQAAKPRLAPADVFRATVCAPGSCVVVEAGGLTFIFGASKGASDSIALLGLMHPNMDALLLPDLAVETVEGLAAISEAVAMAGRREPLKVFGPAGLLPVIDGANLIVSATREARLAAGVEGEDQGPYGRTVFDSGIVSVRGFGGVERGAGRVYRIDFDTRSLILAGCSALPEDIIAAAREAKLPIAVLVAGSERLLGSSPGCMDLPAVTQVVAQAKAASGVVVPGRPAATDPAAVAAWRELLSDLGNGDLTIGLPGTVIDLTSERPRTSQDAQE